MSSRSAAARSTARAVDSAVEGAPFVGGAAAAASLSATLGPLGAVPTRARQVGGERALPCRCIRDLLCGDGDGAAAFGDALDGEHNLVGRRALLLGRELALPPDPRHPPHHPPSPSHLLDAFLHPHPA